MERMKQGKNGDNSSSSNNNIEESSTLYSLFDENEKDIASILLQLPQLIEDSDSRNRFSFNWGLKRKRSAIASPSPSPPRSIPPPPPPPPLPSPTPTPTPAPVFGTCAAAAMKQETTSPATPLSFSPSESDEKSKRSSRKSSKRRRKREEWLEMIAELTQRKELLKREVENVRLHYNKLKAENLDLKAKKAKKAEAELRCGEKVGGTCMEINKSLNLKLEFAQPIVKPATTTMKIEDMENHHHQQAYHQPLIINRTVRKKESYDEEEEVKFQQHPCSQLSHQQQWSSSSSSYYNSRGPLGGMIIPDLNVSIEDGCGMDSSSLSLHQQHFDFIRGALPLINNNNNNNNNNKATMAAEARKKRRQIYKVKNNNSIAPNKPRYGHR